MSNSGGALIRGARGLWQARARLSSKSSSGGIPPEGRMSWMLLPTKKVSKSNVEGEGQLIIDEEMQRVGGQKLAMPNLLTPENWKKTGRWQSTGDELFSFKDRKNATMLLGPTHEEEVTAIVKDMVRSYRQYPLRLYQTTRKFRDEARPRAGLLRGREFMMKDMYTFDVGKQQ
ncbi:prolyl-tRNA synthetase, partial [Coemansia sp. RSA 2611]